MRVYQYVDNRNLYIDVIIGKNSFRLEKMDVKP